MEAGMPMYELRYRQPFASWETGQPIVTYEERRHNFLAKDSKAARKIVDDVLVSIIVHSQSGKPHICEYAGLFRLDEVPYTPRIR